MKLTNTEVNESDDNHKLHQLYKNLEEEWDDIKQSKLSVLRRCSTDSSIVVKTFPLLDNSPRSLMSSLHHRKSPSDQVAWKVRNNDLAVIEILIERRAAIESGKLKGRRLFEELEDVSEVGFGSREEICDGWNEFMSQDCEVRSISSYDSDNEEEVIGGRDEELPVSCRLASYSSSSTFTTSVNDEREVKELPESKRRWSVGLGWFAVALIVCVVSIISIRSFCGLYEYEVILVPT